MQWALTLARGGLINHGGGASLHSMVLRRRATRSLFILKAAPKFEFSSVFGLSNNSCSFYFRRANKSSAVVAVWEILKIGFLLASFPLDFKTKLY